MTVSQFLVSRDLSAIMSYMQNMDEELYLHSMRVRMYTDILIAGLVRNHMYEKRMPQDVFTTASISALLHDIGKLQVSRDILDKPGKLTAEEFARVKQHPGLGEVYLRENVASMVDKRSFCAIRNGVLHHHEFWNGTGYPYGLSKEGIPFVARVVSLADVFDALTSDRPYRSRLSVNDSFEVIISESGKHFDPELVQAFVLQYEAICKLVRR